MSEFEKNIIDENRDEDVDYITYGSFWQRAGALILDGLILAPVSLPLTLLNITSWKSIPILILSTILLTLYKPFMEYRFSATLGKMAMKLSIVDYNLEKPSMPQILLRNIFHIFSAFTGLIAGILVFNTPGFQQVTDLESYLKFSESITILPYNQYITYGIFLAEIFVFFQDEQKRSLHDKIGKTLVVAAINK